ncbi:3261_t:CDS:2, partial [Scutellospora calospora]
YSSTKNDTREVSLEDTFENNDILTMLDDQDIPNNEDELSTSSLPRDNYDNSEDILSDNLQEVEQIPLQNNNDNQIPATFNKMDDVLE